MLTTPRPTESDHELLLQPITPESPTGAWLRYDPVYDQINAARRAEDASLSQGVWQRPAHQADWRLVEELCYSALESRSKDLQLAVWLTEAWLHLYGIAGISSGCQLIKDLHDAYLVTMFPAPELVDKSTLPLDSHDDAIEHRLNMLQWLNEKLSLEIKLLPLTAPSENDGVPSVSLADIEAARHKSHAARQPGQPPIPTDPLDAGLARSLALTPQDDLAATWTDLHRALDVVQALGTALDEYYGESNGGFLRIADALTEMIAAIAPGLSTLRRTTSLPAARPAASEPEVQPMEEVVETITATSQPRTLKDLQPGIKTRDEAYALLAEIAAFLARIEPHSPVPYLLQRAIAWGGMSLQELLPELLNDPAALKDVGHLLRLQSSGRSPNNNP